MAATGQGRNTLLERLLGGKPGRVETETFGLVHHRDLRGGGFRAAIFGVSDGLVSNVSLILGTAGAHPGAGIVRLAGLAGLLGGAFSMGAGEYVSMRGQQEALERELELERGELDRHPAAERRELENIYVQRGVTEEVARQLVAELMSSPESALSAHARDELGIDPDELGSPIQAAISSFVAFSVGAFAPLAPFLRGSSGSGAVIAAIVIATVVAVVAGATLAVFTGRSVLYSAGRSLLICAVAGGVTYAIGSAVGVQVH